MFIDAHTHHKSIASHQVSLVVGEHSIGIHPWELVAPFSRTDFDCLWDQLEQREKVIWFVGECGLDRVKRGIASIEDQRYVLKKHFELAAAKKIPLVLHSVRAMSDYLEIFKKTKFNHSILFHDFSGNHEEVEALLKYPTFFSFGHRLFKNGESLKLVPLERVLFETDDQKDLAIESIYKRASEILNVPLPILEKKIEENFLRFFGQFDNICSTDFINNFRS